VEYRSRPSWQNRHPRKCLERFVSHTEATVPVVISSEFERSTLNCDLEDHMSIWTVLFVVLLVAWIGGFSVFHVAGGLIHLLLVFAVISLILHFVMGARTA
jgi:hypothetical protein